MKPKFLILIGLLSFTLACKQKEENHGINIIFLHHSTGEVIWNGKPVPLIIKAIKKVSDKLADFVNFEAQLPLLFEEYNKINNSNYNVEEMIFPKASPYGWNNYPFDYYNIWVKNAGDSSFMDEPTLEMLTEKYQVVIFKHCFPVSNINADSDTADIDSDLKTTSNYMLQYEALKTKLLQFPETKFILFTGAAQVKANIDEDKAKRAADFFSWVREEWDQPDDNIYIWDLYSLQTEGGLYFKDEYAVSEKDSHPNGEFAGRVVKLLFSRIIDVITNNGKSTNQKGEPL